MNTLYLDIFSGISGDMFLGAMIDLGVDVHTLELELEKLGVEGYHIHAERAQKGSITGIKFDVHLESDHDHGHGHNHEHGDQHNHEHDHAHGHAHHHTHKHEHEHEHERPHAHEHNHEHHEHGHSHEHHHEHEHVHHGRGFGEIEKLILGSSLSEWVKQRSIAVFRRIAIAEGKVHGKPPEEVHFHEVGAIDSNVDIVGACIALELMGKPRVLAAPVVEGTGWVECAHGRFPVPALATLEILGAKGIDVSQCDEPHELVTPTGAAILAEFVEHFGLMQSVRANKVGYGLGTRDNKTRPNVLRAVLESASTANATSDNDWETDLIAVLETNIDDSTAEVIGHFTEKAMSAGALDVFCIHAQMKKNRPGVLITVLCNLPDADRLTELLLRETSEFGVRRHTAERRKLRREIVTVGTAFGEIPVKIGSLNGQILHVAPEFDACRKAADKSGAPIIQIQEAATRALNSIHIL